MEPMAFRLAPFPGSSSGRAPLYLPVPNQSLRLCSPLHTPLFIYMTTQNLSLSHSFVYCLLACLSSCEGRDSSCLSGSFMRVQCLAIFLEYNRYLTISIARFLFLLPYTHTHTHTYECTIYVCTHICTYIHIESIITHT